MRQGRGGAAAKAWSHYHCRGLAGQNWLNRADYCGSRKLEAVGRPEDMPDLARAHLAPFVTRTASYFGWPVSDPDRLREIVGRFGR